MVKLVGWQIIQGRDFSKDFPSDSAAFILNETAVKFMGLKHPVGEQVSFNDGVAFTVIGVVKDFVMESPYAPVRPSMFRLLRYNDGMLMLKLNPKMSAHDALDKVSAVLKNYDPTKLFNTDLLMKNMQRNLVTKNASAILQQYLQCLQFLFHAWDYLACIICCRTTNKRNWCKKSIGCISI